jgi:hypothetical protein
LLSQGLPERVLELVVIGLHRLPCIGLGASALDVDLVRGGHANAPRALHAIDQVVGPGQLGVEVKGDRLAGDGADEAGIDVGTPVASGPVGAHRDEIIKTVAAIDIHPLIS